MSTGEGKAQSPIELLPAVEGEVDAIDMRYDGARFKVVSGKTGPALQPLTSVWMAKAFRRHELVEVHFHMPAEHTVDDVEHQAEAHLVHTTSTGGIAVVGVIIAEGRASRGLEEVLKTLEAAEGSTASLDPRSLLPRATRRFQYDGSLTTPPYAEGVSWTVFESPIEASAAQLARLSLLVGEMSRPVQARNDRTVTVGS